MVTTTVTIKGQIVIPSEIRRRHNIKKGTKVCIEEKGDELIIRPLTPEYFSKLAGILGTKGKLTKALLAERAKDKERGA